MEKKKRIKVGLAAGFVAVCGVLCLMFRGGWRENDRIVFEQAGTVAESNKSLANEERQFADMDSIAKDSNLSDAQKAGETEDAEPVLCVHICGAVVKEGVYCLPEGSRLMDGIAAAGGFSEVADTTYHNLAALLADGQKVYVPTRDETTGVSVEERVSDTNAEDSGETVSAKRKVNLNTASLAELMTLSGIGEAKAKSILQYREKVGPFGQIEEIKNISGIGEAMYDRIKEDITVE